MIITRNGRRHVDGRWTMVAFFGGIVMTLFALALMNITACGNLSKPATTITGGNHG